MNEEGGGNVVSQERKILLYVFFGSREAKPTIRDTNQRLHGSRTRWSQKRHNFFPPLLPVSASRAPWSDAPLHCTAPDRPLCAHSWLLIPSSPFLLSSSSSQPRVSLSSLSYSSILSTVRPNLIIFFIAIEFCVLADQAQLHGKMQLTCSAKRLGGMRGIDIQLSVRLLLLLNTALG